MYSIVYTKQAVDDAAKLAAAALSDKANALLAILRTDPFASLPPYQKLAGDLQGAYSRRINVNHRLIYQVLENDAVVKVISLWSQHE